MKKSRLITVVLLSVIVCVCVMFAGCELLPHQHNYSNAYEGDANYHWQVCTICKKATNKTEHDYYNSYQRDANNHWRVCKVCNRSVDTTAHTFGSWVQDVNPTETSSGHKYRDCDVCLYRQEQTIPKLGAQSTGTVDLYAINDFHGEHARLAQISGYIAGRLGEGNTVALNSGDMFQGSIQSNSNYGSLFTQCMDIAGFDAFTFGNHEFDWGLDNLRSLAANSTTPFLGANIYNWNADTKTWGEFADDLAEQYVIKDLDNGLRVGIIGVIGKDQITSISSQLVQTIGFKDPAEVVPALSNKLRNELGCDIIVVSAHTGQSTFLNDTNWDITQYADAVFCAHTHYAETFYLNGVPFIQGGSSGNHVSHVQLTVDSNGNVSCDGYENIPYNSLSGVNSYVKDAIQMNIDNSNARIADEANEKIATLSSSLNRYTSLPRLVCHAIADYVASQNIDVDLVICNEARANLSSGSVTYTDLYKALPFDNVVYIARVTGEQIYNEVVKYEQIMWRVSGKAIENSSSKYYTIAVIDYLLFHQNANRSYNYFPSAFYENNTLKPYAVTKTGVDLYHYRLITRDFMKAQGTINTSLYTGTNNHTDSSKLTQAVTF